MDSKLLQLLVCPVTKGALHYDRERQELISRSARLAYPVRDGIPVLLESEARALDENAFDDANRSTGAQPGYVVLIPARMASHRLPGKPLADIAGLPMVVRVAQRAAQGTSARCVVATDDARILEACAQHGVEAILTDSGHASGSDRLAQACGLLGLGADDIVVNLQGDEPLIDPQWLDAVAQLLHTHPRASMGTAACRIHSAEEFHNPNVVKVVCNAQGLAQHFSRAPIPFARTHDNAGMPAHALRHIGLYSYRAAFLRRFATLEPAPDEKAEQLEQLRALWHGHQIAVHVGDGPPPPPGVDTAQDLERVRAWFAEHPQSLNLQEKGNP